METPALVIGHQYDLIHPFSDAGMLASELPNASAFAGAVRCSSCVSPRGG